jgi:exodeoxyribonuclease V alpha subunit
MKPQPVPSTQEVLAGLVERVTYHNAENGFCVLRAKALGHRDLVTVVGHAATIEAGEWITASGEWVNDRTQGQQFKAQFLRTSAPTSADGIEKYLSSGMIRGVGPVYAKKLVRAFGEKVFDVIETGRARSMASGRFAQPAFWPPGLSRRRSGKSWCSCTATGVVRGGRSGFSSPTGQTRSKS